MRIFIFNTLDNRIYSRICILFLAVLLITIMPIEVIAQSNEDAISRVLCNIVNKLNGPIGKGISTIAIIVLGIGLFLGKLSWGLAVATAIGIGMIFGAAQIVAWVSNGVTASPIIFSEICA